MGSNGRTVRMSSQQIERRRRNQFKRKVFNLSIILILIILLLSIGNIYAQLAELQTALKRLESKAPGASRTYAEEQEQEQTNYVEEIASVEVEKPVERTEKEVLERLGELGQNNSVIQEVYENHSQYPQELLSALANNPEMAEFAAGYPGYNGRSRGALTSAEKQQEHPLFLQWDPRWGYQTYGSGSCIGLAGCGPTCLSMALFYLTGDDKLTPNKIAEYSMENGYYVEGTGTAWALMEDVPKLYGISVTKLSAEESSIRAILDRGGVVICSMGRGDFTTSGHYILIYGYDSEGLLINDPNCVSRSGRHWSFESLKYQMKNIWAYMPDGRSAATESSITVLYQDIRENR